ncbi:MAG: hypothetical protein K8T20_09700 [Planctomycetes bacterium]|nr:hypothetical protein [Planctomycetota bacterium]
MKHEESGFMPSVTLLSRLLVLKAIEGGSSTLQTLEEFARRLHQKGAPFVLPEGQSLGDELLAMQAEGLVVLKGATWTLARGGEDLLKRHQETLKNPELSVA